MTAQLWALAVVSTVVLAAAVLERWRSTHARGRALGTYDATSAGPSSGRSSEPYILYFTGEGCTVCRTHQEPALARLGGVRIDRVDAIAERELADWFHVYTLPTTVVMSPVGTALEINYGYAPANKLERQLSEARGGAGLRVSATA